MAYVYVVDGSEDGVIGIYSNAKKAMQRAMQYALAANDGQISESDKLSFQTRCTPAQLEEKNACIGDRYNATVAKWLVK